MSDTSQQIQSLDESSALAFLREGAIGRQQQSGSLSNDQMQNIRLGQQDQSLGLDDAVYALTNAEDIWPQAQQHMEKQQT